VLTCYVTYTASALDLELLYSTKRKMYLYVINNYTTIDNSHYTIMCCKVGLFIDLTSTSGNGCMCLVHPIIFRIVKKAINLPGLSKQNTLCSCLFLMQFLRNRVGWIDRYLAVMYRDNYSCHVSDL
jgi:hypothetical protein